MLALASLVHFAAGESEPDKVPKPEHGVKCGRNTAAEVEPQWAPG